MVMVSVCVATPAALVATSPNVYVPGATEEVPDYAPVPFPLSVSITPAGRTLLVPTRW